jgi:hypothetical protein
MKAKPNIEEFTPHKDPDAFLEGGASDLANKSKKPQQAATESQVMITQPPAKVYREQKIFRLPVDLINELKREAYEQSVKTKTRVTETELVEQALRAFLKLDI